jgi:hypothetical protein
MYQAHYPPEKESSPNDDQSDLRSEAIVIRELEARKQPDNGGCQECAVAWFDLDLEDAPRYDHERAHEDADAHGAHHYRISGSIVSVLIGP